MDFLAAKFKTTILKRLFELNLVQALTYWILGPGDEGRKNNEVSKENNGAFGCWLGIRGGTC
ncbi:hypothetical protein OAD74_01055 [Alphaproteobacteria bacterium]|nr:hypothetical protein [Alphaproteobacteria bacterium]